MKEIDDLVKKNLDYELKMKQKTGGFIVMSFKIVAWIFIALGVLFCLTMIGIPLGIMLLVMGFLMLKFGVKFIQGIVENEVLKENIKKAQFDNRQSK